MALIFSFCLRVFVFVVVRVPLGFTVVFSFSWFLELLVVVWVPSPADPPLRSFLPLQPHLRPRPRFICIVEIADIQNQQHHVKIHKINSIMIVCIEWEILRVSYNIATVTLQDKFTTPTIITILS